MLIVWVVLMGLFLAFCWSFDLSYSFMLDRAPILLGLELRDGFIQGAALTLFICLDLDRRARSAVALAAALGAAVLGRRRRVGVADLLHLVLPRHCRCCSRSC